MHTEPTVASDLGITSATTSPFLPRVVAEDPQVDFRLDDCGRGFNLVFVTAEMLAQSPFTPMWIMQCGDRATLHAAARWAAVRRHRWADWATLAQALGHEDFDAYMRQLLTDEPMMHAVATMVRTNYGANEVVFSQMLASGTSRGSDEVVRHRFASAENMQRFLDWLYSDGVTDRADQLVGYAFSAGTDAFGALLEDVVKVPSRQQRRQAARSRMK